MTGRSKVLQTIDEFAILRLPVTGFGRLPLREKLLAYHLYRAAVAGRDIHFDQNHRHALAIREICERILLHPEGIEPAVLRNVGKYLELQFLNGGIYGKFTYAKFLPPKGLTFRRLKDAALRAERNGGRFPLCRSGSLHEHLETLRPTMFDPSFEPYTTTRSPAKGEDPLSASANNLYERGLRLSDLDGFRERYPLNSTVLRRKGRVVEEVWRSGDTRRRIPPGRYAEAIDRIVRELESAIPHATPPHAKALRLLIDYYRTGDPETFRRYNIAWLKYRRPTIDTINGFIEEYRDPREKKGAWEGTTFFVNETTSGWLRKVALKADYYERRSPIDEAYKRKGSKPIANMVEVLVSAGDGGPVLFAGVNLPNDQALRQKYGSKNVLLWNSVEARTEVAGERLVREFFLPKDREIILKHRKVIPEILVGFHETLGHASGKKSDRLREDPSHYLPGYYSWLEEERADLVALHHAWDPETFRIRKDWTEEAARALYKRYPTIEMIQLAEIPASAERIEEPHLVGGIFAVNYFIRHGVVQQLRREVSGKMKTFWVVPDEKIPEMRRCVAELLRELQRIKSEGDLPAMERLARTYRAAEYDKKVAAEVRARKRSLSIPDHVAFVFPELEIVKRKSLPVDVRITYPKGFLQQQMGWSSWINPGIRPTPDSGKGCSRRESSSRSPR
jgi:dipeptidyl-peptidase-3